MPKDSQRSLGEEQQAQDAERVPHAGPAADAGAGERPGTGSVRQQLSRGEQERLRRKLREKFH